MAPGQLEQVSRTAAAVVVDSSWYAHRGQQGAPHAMHPSCSRRNALRFRIDIDRQTDLLVLAMSRQEAFRGLSGWKDGHLAW